MTIKHKKQGFFERLFGKKDSGKASPVKKSMVGVAKKGNHPGSIKVYSKESEIPVYSRILNRSLHVTDKEKGSDASALALDHGGSKVIILVSEALWGSTAHLRLSEACLEAGWQVHQQVRATAELVRVLMDKEYSQRTALKTDAAGDDYAIVEFDKMIGDALRQRASDVHFERRDGGTMIRFRVFGDLHEEVTISNEKAESLLRVAITMYGDQGNKPQAFEITTLQQGSVTRMVDEVTTKLRFQTAPAFTITGNGQDAVFRLLPMSGQNSNLTFEQLGYLPYQVELLMDARSAPEGMTLFAGVTGSGKSTSLECFIRGLVEYTEGQKKIITVEDPVELIMKGVTQIPVPRGFITDRSPFLEPMRASMRMDPDVIMVGEVRDKDSAQLAQTMVLTGHMVPTTVHTSSCYKVPIRLADLGCDLRVMGAPDFFNLIVYQKLVQTLCPRCAVPFIQTDYMTDSSMRRRIERFRLLAGDEFEAVKVIPRDGAHENCPVCHGRGNMGRQVVAEMMEPDIKINEFIARGDEIGLLKHWVGTDWLHKRAIGSAALKMREGIVSPFQIEDAFGESKWVRDVNMNI